VNLTETDFIELQNQLESLNPSRSSKLYEAVDVVATKSSFLRSLNPIDFNAAAHLAKSDMGSNNNLVPPLPADASRDLAGSTNTPSTVTDTVDVDDDTDSDESDADLDSNPAPPFTSYIFADAAELSKRPTPIFPRIIRYMDLPVLGLKYLTRVPQLTLIRDEWEIFIDIVNGRCKGIRGSAIITGQPGIGEHRYYP
jgi:hypothetical protein